MTNIVSTSQATLNVLEMYGSLFGLKVNMEKNIWIGKKKHSSDLLLISAKLDCDTSEFSLLEILVPVYLERVPRI